MMSEQKNKQHQMVTVKMMKNIFFEQKFSPECKKKDSAIVVIAQPMWEGNPLGRDKNDLPRVKFDNDTKNFIHSILKLAHEKQADLVVFPEFSVPLQFHKEIKKWSDKNSTIVIAGTDYVEDDNSFYNTSTIFFNGCMYKTEKLILSPLETSSLIGEGPSSREDHQFYFSATPVGNLGVVICSDLFFSPTHEVMSKLSSLDLDILCVLAFQNEPVDHHAIIHSYLRSSDCTFVIYCNSISKHIAGGCSAVFAPDYPDRRKNSKDNGLLRNDDTCETKQIEMPNLGGCLIVSCNLKQRNVRPHSRKSNRGLVGKYFPYAWNKDSLVEMKKDLLLEHRTQKNEVYALAPEQNSRESYNNSIIRMRSMEHYKRVLKDSNTCYYEGEPEELILPKIPVTLQDDNSETNITDIVSYMQTLCLRHIQIIGEGGTGKTSSLLKIWEGLINNNQYNEFFVNYVPLRFVNSYNEGSIDKYTVLRQYASNYLYDDIELSQSQVNEIYRELEKNPPDKKGHFIFLLDGFNEVKTDYKQEIADQIIKLSRMPNVIIILSSREKLDWHYTSEEIIVLNSDKITSIKELPMKKGGNTFACLKLLELHDEAIKKYLETYDKNINEAQPVWGLLRNPMMLTVFCATDEIIRKTERIPFFVFRNPVTTTDDLINNYLESLHGKAFIQMRNSTDLVIHLWMTNFVLPHIAYTMNTSERYQIDYSSVKQCLKTIIKIQVLYAKYFEEWFDERNLEDAWQMLVASETLLALSKEFLTSFPAVFTCETIDNSNWIFTHQLYRDFLSAKYILFLCELVYNGSRKNPINEVLPISMSNVALLINIARLIYDYNKSIYEVPAATLISIKKDEFCEKINPFLDNLYSDKEKKECLELVDDTIVILSSINSAKNHLFSTIMDNNLFEQAALVLLPLVGGLGLYQMKLEIEEQLFSRKSPERYRNTREYVQKIEPLMELACDKVIEKIRNGMAEYEINCQISRRKLNTSEVNIQMKDGSTYNLNKYYTLYIITDSIRDCYTVIGVLHSLWRPMHGCFKDYIALPMPDMYQAIHTTLMEEILHTFEVIVRTKKMAVIDYGGLERLKLSSYNKDLSENSIIKDVNNHFGENSDKNDGKKFN